MLFVNGREAFLSCGFRGKQRPLIGGNKIHSRTVPASPFSIQERGSENNPTPSACWRQFETSQNQEAGQRMAVQSATTNGPILRAFKS